VATLVFIAYSAFEFHLLVIYSCYYSAHIIVQNWFEVLVFILCLVKVGYTYYLNKKCNASYNIGCSAPLVFILLIVRYLVCLPKKTWQCWADTPIHFQSFHLQAHSRIGKCEQSSEVIYKNIRGKVVLHLANEHQVVQLKVFVSFFWIWISHCNSESVHLHKKSESLTELMLVIPLWTLISPFSTCLTQSRINVLVFILCLVGFGYTYTEQKQRASYIPLVLCSLVFILF
jgi:hypothetical protein